MAAIGFQDNILGDEAIQTIAGTLRSYSTLGYAATPPSTPKEKPKPYTLEALSAAALKRRQTGKAWFKDLVIGDITLHPTQGQQTVAGIDPNKGLGITFKSTKNAWPYNLVPLSDYGVILLTAQNLPASATKTDPKQSTKGKVSFESVILPAAKKEAIIDAIRQVDNHDLIFNQWGFGDVFEKGTAISMLFYGLPGTGKTLMAQAIADKYDYELKIVSTAEIETPEPGGAERNIAKYFAEAATKEGGKKQVLLFDECDSLICDRKHLGMIMAAQVNALLTALEHHTGIVIFTTNRLGALDPAFDRRLSLKMEFEMPDAKHRKQIWLRMFPSSAPLAKDIDWEAISDVEMAGGHIKNVVLRSARRAANTTKKITQDIIVEALLEEAKANTSFSEAIANHAPFYGTPMNKRNVDIIRNRTNTSVDRG